MAVAKSPGDSHHRSRPVLVEVLAKPLERMNRPRPKKSPMKKEKIVNGDLLFHPVHGLCRVERVTQPGPSYSLVPKIATKMKSRFVISAADMEVSGFHNLVSPKEANKILHYLKAGNGKDRPGSDTTTSPQVHAWDLAHGLLTFAHDKFEAKDQRKRQALERSAKGLVGELACVFKLTLKKTADRIQKNLGRGPRINPSVLSALTLAGED